MPTINSVAASTVGNVRDNNEDNFFLNGKIPDASIKDTTIIETNHADSGLFAVCDGMGGEAFGEVASAIAVNTLQKLHRHILEHCTSFEDAVTQYADEANMLICNEIERNGGQRMGTTFAVLYIQNDTAYICNIGDSRVYLFRNNTLAQLSVDHTQIRRLIDMGILTVEKARTHPERHKLTQHLGLFPDEIVIEPFVSEPVDIMDGDVFLLCSDGLSDMLDDNEIEKIMNEYTDPQDIANKLVDAALINGGKDNVTIIINKICNPN